MLYLKLEILYFRLWKPNNHPVDSKWILTFKCESNNEMVFFRFLLYYFGSCIYKYTMISARTPKAVHICLGQQTKGFRIGRNKDFRRISIQNRRNYGGY